MSTQKFVLGTGSEIPALGLDTSIITSLQCQKAVEGALLNGYLHLHVQSGHENEGSVGRAIETATHSSGIERNKIFITVTVSCTPNTVIERSLDQSLAALSIEYTDLCLMQWEEAATSGGKSHIDAYKDLENLKRRWKTRAVGVCDYSLESLQELVPQVSMKPAVNRFDISSSQHGEELVDYCNWNGLLVLASKPVGVDTDRLAFIQHMAKEYETTPANILLSWHTSSRQAVLLDSVPSKKTALVELNRGDVYSLDELFSKDTGSSTTSKFISLMPESGLSLLDKAGFTRPEAKRGQVLPVL